MQPDQTDFDEYMDTMLAEEGTDKEALERVEKIPHILLVNGPPRSGKDTVGEVIVQNHPGKVYVTKFAKLLKERTHALYGIFSTDGSPVEHDFFEENKDVINPLFYGKTPRQAYIAVSEKYMKPEHGDSIWGRLLIEDITMHGMDADLVVVTDSGFAEEAHVLMNRFGEENMSLIHVIRDGTDFGNDSRSYISLPSIPMDPIVNNGTLGDLALALAEIVPTFRIAYHVEVQLPAANELRWFEQGEPRPTLEQALAAVEALRQGSYASRVLRVRAGANTVRMVMPGDAPVLELN